MVDDTISPTQTIPTTTTSTTNVLVPPVTQIPANPFADYQGLAVFAVGLFILMGVASKVLEFSKNISEWFDRKKKRVQDQDAPLEARLKTLEESHRNFKHRDELDREFNSIGLRFDHEKANRQAIQEGFDTRLRNVQEQVQQDALARTRLETKVEGIAQNHEKVEASLEKIQERIEDRFDRLHAAIMSTRGAND